MISDCQSTLHIKLPSLKASERSSFQGQWSNPPEVVFLSIHNTQDFPQKQAISEWEVKLQGHDTRPSSKFTPPPIKKKFTGFNSQHKNCTLMIIYKFSLENCEWHSEKNNFLHYIGLSLSEKSFNDGIFKQNTSCAGNLTLIKLKSLPSPAVFLLKFILGENYTVKSTILKVT